VRAYGLGRSEQLGHNWPWQLATVRAEEGASSCGRGAVAVEEPDVRLISNVVDVEPEDMRVGLEVEVFFEDWTGLSGGEDTRVWIPLFRPETR
jgi:uncharacterized OB-fold protein